MTESPENRQKKARKADLTLPLLTRELIEAANRRRTYGTRVAYAVILTLFLISAGTAIYSQDFDPFAILGQGYQLFLMLSIIQFIAIYLLVPAMTCSAITVEKEKNTISLLLISKLGPWTIIFEKLFGRMIPSIMCLLVALPIMAVLFSIGGMSDSMIWSALYLESVTVFQCASLSLMCSSIFRKTSTAFLWTLGLGFLWIMGMPTFCEIFNPGGADDFAYVFFTPYIMVVHAFTSGISSAILRSLPILFVSGLCLVVARFALVRCALSKKAPLATRILNAGRSVARDIRTDITGEGQPVKNEPLTPTPNAHRLIDRTNFPTNHPIRWRYGRSLFGNRSFVGGSGCLMFFLATLACFMASVVPDTGSQYLLTGVPWVLLLLFSCLMTAVRASGFIPNERGQQTLDVLLVSPLTTREILIDRMRVLHRFNTALAVPMTLLLLYLVGWRQTYHASYQRAEFDGMLYVVTGFAMMLVYPRLIAWLSLAISLRTKEHASAMLYSIVLTIGWCILPLILYIPYFLMTMHDATRLWIPTIQLSPFVLMALNEGGEWPHYVADEWFTLFCHFGLQIGFLKLLKWWTLTRAAQVLGRGEHPQSKQSFTNPVTPIDMQSITTS